MSPKTVNPYISSPADLVNTHESRRAGFLEYALRKSKEAIPYIDKAKALKVILEKQTNVPKDILKIHKIRKSCYEAAGVSVKANNHLNESDLDTILEEFIREFLEPAGHNYREELIFRYLLTSGDALGGRMRNIIGSIASEKFTRFIISQLEVIDSRYELYDKKSESWIESKMYSIDILSSIRGIKWGGKKDRARQLIYNCKVPIVNKNIDLVLLNKHTNDLRAKSLGAVLSDVQSYIMLGELKGGIDPAGADEHWKTANTALSRVRDSFLKHNMYVPLVFVGAAIEKSMSVEIFNQYTDGRLANCANLTDDKQLAALSNWLVSQL
jgi:hypothetical protein